MFFFLLSDSKEKNKETNNNMARLFLTNIPTERIHDNEGELQEWLNELLLPICTNDKNNNNEGNGKEWPLFVPKVKKYKKGKALLQYEEVWTQDKEESICYEIEPLLKKFGMDVRPAREDYHVTKKVLLSNRHHCSDTEYNNCNEEIKHGKNKDIVFDGFEEKQHRRNHDDNRDKIVEAVTISDETTGIKHIHVDHVDESSREKYGDSNQTGLFDGRFEFDTSLENEEEKNNNNNIPYVSVDTTIIQQHYHHRAFDEKKNTKYCMIYILCGHLFPFAANIVESLWKGHYIHCVIQQVQSFQDIQQCIGYLNKNLVPYIIQITNQKREDGTFDRTKPSFSIRNGFHRRYIIFEDIMEIVQFVVQKKEIITDKRLLQEGCFDKHYKNKNNLNHNKRKRKDDHNNNYNHNKRKNNNTFHKINFSCSSVNTASAPETLFG